MAAATALMEEPWDFMSRIFSRSSSDRYRGSITFSSAVWGIETFVVPPPASGGAIAVVTVCL